MRILVVSFYYQPDLSAGSFRSTAFVRELAKVVPVGSQIDVVTTQPNRYQSFSPDAAAAEHEQGISIHRIKLPKHASGLADQSRAFMAFAKGALAVTSGKEYDIVFATSGRLLTAAVGSLIARKKRAVLYLDIRDIFVDTINDLLFSKLSWIVKPVFSGLERWTVTRAAHVNLVSRGFAPYFTRRYPTMPLSFITNGIDDEFLAAAPSAPGATRVMGDGRPVTVVYAGNIGESQGLHNTIPELARRLGRDVRFRIIGDGGRRVPLEAALARAGVDNVELVPPMARDALLEEYRKADVLFLQLGDYPALTTVLPSKLFEYAALGKPMLAGVAGYTAEFVRSEISNAAVFPPGNVDGAIEALRRLTLQDAPRVDFCAKFARSTLCQALAEHVVETLRENAPSAPSISGTSATPR